MVELQVRLIIARCAAKELLLEPRQTAGNEAEAKKKIAQPAVHCPVVRRVNVSSSSAFRVDGRNSLVMRGAQRAAANVRTRPTPEIVETRRHLGLDSVDLAFFR